MNIYLEQKEENVKKFNKGITEFKKIMEKLLYYNWSEDGDSCNDWYCLFPNVLCKMIDNDYEETKELLKCLDDYGINGKYYSLSRSDACYEEAYIIDGKITNSACIDLHDAVYYDGYDENLDEKEAKDRQVKAIKESIPSNLSKIVDEWRENGGLDDCYNDGEYDPYEAVEVLGSFISEYLVPSIDSNKLLKLPIDLEIVQDEEDEWSF